MAEVLSRSIELPNGHEGILTVLPDRATWGEGTIVAPELTQEQLRVMAEAAQKSLVVVTDNDLRMSGCTDGRFREGLLDGNEAPVWQKTVGTDLLTGFAMAEAIGRPFYVDLVEAPVMKRIEFFANFMKENGDNPTAHEECGARKGFPVIVGNAIRYVDQNSPLLARVGYFGGEMVSDEAISQVSHELSGRDYEGWDAGGVQKIVERLSGTKAVKKLATPHDHPNHGHEEFAEIRLETPGIAFSARKYIGEMQQSGDPILEGSNAFSNNDDRVRELARMIADNPAQEALALTAGLLYSEAGWSTLGNGQYTIRIQDSSVTEK